MAHLYTLIILGVICFQIALIGGAPWGHLTQGGRNGGPLPKSQRVAAAVSIIILIALAMAVQSSDGNWPFWPRWTGWIAVGVNGIVTLLNWITRSKPERLLWAPVTTAMLALAVWVVATGP